MGLNALECTVENCLHNTNNMCNAQYINVISRKVQNGLITNCKTFEAKGYNSSLTNVTNVNITGAIDQIFTEDPVMNPNIRCGVEECIYNSNYMCGADKVDIGDYNASSSYQTKCRTYKRG